MEMPAHEVLTTARELAFINYVLTKRIADLEEERDHLLIKNTSLQAIVDDNSGVTHTADESYSEAILLEDIS